MALGVLIVAVALLGPGAARAQGPPPAGSVRPIVFAVFPFFSPGRMEEIFGPIAAYLGRSLGQPVHFRTASSYERFSEQMAAGAFDIALLNPLQYLRAADEHGYHPLVRPQQPLSTLFLVRSDSPVKTLMDLRDRVVAMPPAEAASAQMGLYALRHAGLVPGVGVRVRYFDSHQTCIHHVIIRTAAACVTGLAPRRVAEAEYGLVLRVAHEAPQLPPPLFVAHPRLAEGLRARIVDALVGLSASAEGRQMLGRTGFSPFVATDGAEYAPVRGYLRLLEGR